jgi:23S rRNA C2498 (ribose-2'-O)-methylase RlmM
MRLSGRVLIALGMVAVVCGACPNDWTRVLFSQMFAGTAAR